jgi:hypothetical protein
MVPSSSYFILQLRQSIALGLGMMFLHRDA